PSSRCAVRASGCSSRRARRAPAERGAPSERRDYTRPDRERSVVEMIPVPGEPERGVVTLGAVLGTAPAVTTADVPGPQDPLVVALLRSAGDPEACDAGVQRLLVRHVEPLASRLLALEVGRGTLTPVDAEDLRSEVVLRLLRKLRLIVSEAHVHGIA